MTKTDHYLLALVRLGLGLPKTEEPFSFGELTSEQWRELIDLSFTQGIDAISVDGFDCLKEQTNLDAKEIEQDKYSWLGSLFVNEDRYGHYLKVIKKLAAAYKESGVETMLLKGYGLSLYYPTPNHRLMGDIDTYHFGNWREADAIVKKHGVKIDYSHHHHSVFAYKGISVENHYDIINRYANRYGAYLDDKLKTLAVTDRKEVEIDGVKVYLPSATFNGIFLLWHNGAHFSGSSLILRQLIDWALFVDKEWSSIDWNIVLPEAERLGLTRFLSCLNALCVDYLSIDAAKFPSLERDCELEKKVMEDIFHPAYQGSTGLIGKCRRLRANMWKRKLVYPEHVVPMLVRLLWSHIKKPATPGVRAEA